MPRYVIVVEDTLQNQGPPTVAIKVFPSPWDIAAPTQRPPDSPAGHLVGAISDVVVGWISNRSAPQPHESPASPETPGSQPAPLPSDPANLEAPGPLLRLVGADDEPLAGDQA